MRKLLKRIAAHQAGSSAVEFALVAPLVLTTLVGTFNFGIYFLAKNTMDHAMDEASRYAAIYPSPSQAQIKTSFESQLTPNVNKASVTFTSTAGTGSGFNYIDMQASTNVKIDLIFVDLGTVPILSKRRVFLPV